MAAPHLQLDPDLCRQRQHRFLEVMAENEIDRVVITAQENIYYFTGFRHHNLMTAALVMEADGYCVLSAPNKEPEIAAVDDVVVFEAQWLSTLRQDQFVDTSTALSAVLDDQSAGRIGADCRTSGPYVLGVIAGSAGVNVAEVVDVEPAIWDLRRKKDPDELAMMKRAIDCTTAMYTRAREIIQPGICELDVYNQLHAAAVEVAGEAITYLGNDYQCGERGGMPRERKTQAGELYILDLGPAYRGYFADNCRTFSVDGNPTDDQISAWNTISEVLDMVAITVKPGLRCQDLFEKASEMLGENSLGVFPHHLGHGVGLSPHETPHLNPNWDDEFREGDVFTAEPGLYGESLHAGIRLEQNYRVTADGVEILTPFPLDL